MENLLQIEIFRNKVKYIIKSDKNGVECDDSIGDAIKKVLPMIDKRYLIKIVGKYNESGAIFDKGNTLAVIILNCENYISQTFVVTSIEELKKTLINIEIADEIKDASLNLNEYDYLIFSKEVFMNIVAITQQYCMENTIQLSNRIELEVFTPSGTYKMFDNGISYSIMEPILGLSNFNNIDMIVLNERRNLWACELNNCITSINMNTGEYTLSLVVKNDVREKDIVRVRRDMKELWNELKICKYQEDKYFCISKRGTNKK